MNDQTEMETTRILRAEMLKSLCRAGWKVDRPDDLTFEDLAMMCRLLLPDLQNYRTKASKAEK